MSRDSFSAADDTVVARGNTPGPSSAELFAAYHQRIRRYILSMVRDPAEADDLTQDVFLRAHHRLGSLRDPDAVVSWLYRIATHVCYDRFRSWSRQPTPSSLDLTDVAAVRASPEGEGGARLDRVIEQAEMSACVRRYLDGLSDDYRQVILLHDVEQVTNPEIAEMLGVSLDAVKIRLHRARRKLQAVLEANCDFSHDECGVLVCEPTGIPIALSSRSAPGVYPSSASGRPGGQQRREGGAPGIGGDHHDVVVER